MLISALHADLLKMKRMPVIAAHLLIPVITSVSFLLYDSFSGWDRYTQMAAFFQTIGAGFPALAGIFTAGVMEQERSAGCFQNLLAFPQKRVGFLSKLILLLILGLFSVLLTAVLFGIGFGCVGKCVVAALIMWCGGIPIYIWQMILAFWLGAGVSVGAGILSGLVSALMLTGLGDHIWKYIFVSWTGRMPYAYLQVVSGSGAAGGKETEIWFYGTFTVCSMAVYLLWVSCWEGSGISEQGEE